VHLPSIIADWYGNTPSYPALHGRLDGTPEGVEREGFLSAACRSSDAGRREGGGLVTDQSDIIPAMRCAPTERLGWLYDQLLEDIAGCVMDRWRGPRKYARVVKVKMSNFKLKR